MAQEGKKVLYLTYNKNLAHNVYRQVTDIENLWALNLHALFGEYVQVNVPLMNENPNRYFAETLPTEFYNYISDLSDSEKEKVQYDWLILDEGQDIIKPLYLYSIDAMLKNGLENGHWIAFYDRNQNIYNPEFVEGFEILSKYQSAKYKLQVNCRNTVQIGKFASKISGIEMTEYIQEDGEEVQKINYSDADDFKSKVEQVLAQLRKEKIPYKDIVFLSPKRYENSSLKAAEIEVNVLNDEFEEGSKLPTYSTIQGFKGLDSKVVVLVDVEHIRDDIFSSFFYVAVTRARELLYIVGSEGFWEIRKV